VLVFQRSTGFVINIFERKLSFLRRTVAPDAARVTMAIHTKFILISILSTLNISVRAPITGGQILYLISEQAKC
jgi:hypothetical protein